MCDECDAPEIMAKGKCRRCYQRQYQRKYLKDNPEVYAQRIEAAREWHKKNHAQYLRILSRWRKNNPDYHSTREREKRKQKKRIYKTKPEMRNGDES